MLTEQQLSASLGSLRDYPSSKDVKLTPRQLDCLVHLVSGLTIKQIVYELALSPKTVEHYLDAVKTKLNCYTRSELIGRALQFNDVRKRL